MALYALLDEKFVDLPDKFGERHSFEHVTSYCTISCHGFICSVGFTNGKLMCYDSMTFTNTRVYKKLSSAVTGISFARDTRHIAAGDKLGLFRINEVDSTETVFERDFKKHISFIQYSPVFLNLILILFDDDTLVLFDQETCEVNAVPGKFGAVAWSPDSEVFYGANESSIFTIKSSGLNIIKTSNLEDEMKKPITLIEISHNGKFLAILDQSGICRLFSFEVDEIVGVYVDKVDRTRFTQAKFDRNDEHIIVSSKSLAAQTFIAYDVHRGFPSQTFYGPREPTSQLIMHPIQPVVYVRYRTGLFKWVPSIRFRFSNSVPLNGLMRSNSVYDEHESEFDEKDYEVEPTVKFEKKKLHADSFLVSTIHYIYPSDRNYPNQLIRLPFIE